MPDDIYAGLHHVSILITDLEQARKFYCDVLGMGVDEARPQLAFNGLWLWVGEQQIHLLALGQQFTGTGASSPGRDAHYALRVKNINDIAGKLDKAGVPYQRSSSGRQALFCRDPDGNGIEFIEIAA
jgi:glyoxylase I family protein